MLVSMILLEFPHYYYVQPTASMMIDAAAANVHGSESTINDASIVVYPIEEIY